MGSFRFISILMSVLTFSTLFFNGCKKEDIMEGKEIKALDSTGTNTSYLVYKIEDFEMTYYPKEFDDDYLRLEDIEQLFKGHSCYSCKKIMIEVFNCENGCIKGCGGCLSDKKRCEGCDSNIIRNDKLTNVINEKYIVKCSYCEKKMKLGEYKTHFEDECQVDCPQKCASKIKIKEMERHIQNECTNTMIKCYGSEFGCDFSETRGVILLHQQNCKDSINYKRHVEEINLLKKELKEKRKANEINEAFTTSFLGELNALTGWLLALYIIYYFISLYLKTNLHIFLFYRCNRFCIYNGTSIRHCSLKQYNFHFSSKRRSVFK